MRGRVWQLVVFVFIVGFTLNLVGIVSHVAVSSLARRWFATPLPGAFTTEWHAYACHEFQLPQVLTVTATVAASVSALAPVLVESVTNFALTFLASDSRSQTLVVALYYPVFAAGMRPIYSVDAMAVLYMGIVLLILVAALRCVRPPQMVFRLGGK